jgi:hypothetical protein
MDNEVVRINNGSNVFVVRACYNDDGADLLAVAGEHSVEVFRVVCALPSRMTEADLSSRDSTC